MSFYIIISAPSPSASVRARLPRNFVQTHNYNPAKDPSIIIISLKRGTPIINCNQSTVVFVIKQSINLINQSINQSINNNSSKAKSKLICYKESILPTLQVYSCVRPSYPRKTPQESIIPQGPKRQKGKGTEAIQKFPSLLLGPITLLLYVSSRYRYSFTTNYFSSSTSSSTLFRRRT